MYVPILITAFSRLVGEMRSSLSSRKEWPKVLQAVWADESIGSTILLLNLRDMEQLGLSNISIWILDISIKYFVYAV